MNTIEKYQEAKMAYAMWLIFSTVIFILAYLTFSLAVINDTHEWFMAIFGVIVTSILADKKSFEESCGQKQSTDWFIPFVIHIIIALVVVITFAILLIFSKSNSFSSFFLTPLALHAMNLINLSTHINH